MPRVTIAAQTPVGPHPSLPVAANALDLAFTAADATNKQQTPLTGPVLLLWRNTGVGARTVTITSAPDGKKRTGDITAFSVGAGESGGFLISNTEGWLQSDGNLYYEAEHAEVVFAVVKLP